MFQSQSLTHLFPQALTHSQSGSGPAGDAGDTEGEKDTDLGSKSCPLRGQREER